MWAKPLQAMWAVLGFKYLFQFAPCSVALQRPRAVQGTSALQSSSSLSSSFARAWGAAIFAPHPFPASRSQWDVLQAVSLGTSVSAQSRSVSQFMIPAVFKAEPSSLFLKFLSLFLSCLPLFPPSPSLTWLWSQFRGFSFLPVLFPLFSWPLSYLQPPVLFLWSNCCCPSFSPPTLGSCSAQVSSSPPLLSHHSCNSFFPLAFSYLFLLLLLVSISLQYFTPLFLLP